MLIVDAHLDLAWNALQWNRNLEHSVYTIRTQENAADGDGRGQGTVALPELRQGRVALCFATLLARSTGHPVPFLDYGSLTQNYAVAYGQLTYYRSLARHGLARIITCQAELTTHFKEWELWDATAETGASQPPPLGIIISMESADPILSPEELPEWWQAGLRVIGPAHFGPGRYAGGTGTELGLTDLGRALLAQMNQVGMLLDMTHLSDQAFWQALELYHGPVLASHNNCRALVPHQRQFSDEQLRAIFQRDGVIGVVFDAWMLQPGWKAGPNANHTVTLANVADHIDHICQLAGNSRHVALGSDLDGGFGRDRSPSDLDTIADLQKIPALLANRGYSTDDIAGIMHGNWLRLLCQSWSQRLQK